jgi:hypothetical protein
MGFIDIRTLSTSGNIPATDNNPFAGDVIKTGGDVGREIVTPITFRATGTVSSSLRICPFATLVPMGFFGTVQEIQTLQDLINSGRGNAKGFGNGDVFMLSQNDRFVLTGCQFTEGARSTITDSLGTKDGSYEIKANFFTV